MENRRASDTYSPWKTVGKALWALIAGFVAFVGPDLANAAVAYFSNPQAAEGVIALIPEAYKPTAQVLLLALMAAGRNWVANHKKAA